MNVYEQVEKLDMGNFCGSAVALGYFDGVHAGHREVIKQAVRYAKRHKLTSAVFTFVNSTFAQNIFDEREKQRRIESLGVQCYIRPQFEHIKGIEAESFVTDVLQGAFCAKAVFCGEDYSFGAGRKGDVALLKKLCRPLGIRVFVVHKVEVDGVRVSSTEIRRLIAQGDFEGANKLLHKQYSLTAPVAHGNRLGRVIGAPTINQQFDEHVVKPLEGVYLTMAFANGRRYYSSTGYGVRPTLDGQNPTVETFLKGFKGDLYGAQVEVVFYKYMFRQRKFDTLQALGAMVRETAQESERYIKALKAAKK